MRTTTSSRLLFAIALPLAYATDLIQHIQVGHNGSFNFTPDTVFSPPGTTLNFIFHGYPHSVAQSSFEKPCLPLPNGIFSGHIADEKYENELSRKTFLVKLNDTNPIWLYSSYDLDCVKGMAMVVNPPLHDNNHPQDLKTYKKAAKKAVGGAPSAVHGGILSTASPSASLQSTTSHPTSSHTTSNYTITTTAYPSSSHPPSTHATTTTTSHSTTMSHTTSNHTSTSHTTVTQVATVHQPPVVHTQKPTTPSHAGTAVSRTVSHGTGSKTTSGSMVMFTGAANHMNTRESLGLSMLGVLGVMLEMLF